MASAVLANHNEPFWDEHKVYMRKHNSSASSNKSNSTPAYNRHPGNSKSNPRSIAKPIQSQDSGTDFVTDDQKLASCSGAKEFVHGGYVTFNLGAYTRHELRELKKRLIFELGQIRDLKAQLESVKSRSGHLPPPQVEEHTPSFGSYNPLQWQEPVKKDHGFKRTSEVLEDSGMKRLALEPHAAKVLAGLMKRCGFILKKLMKHNFSWVFNKPVDTVALKLHDYHDIIKNPMDLGTIKSKLSRKAYKSPMEFASDVRLTFDNAMIYNPEEHDVHKMARNLLNLFNELFDPVYSKLMEEHERVAQENRNPMPVNRDLLCADRFHPRDRESPGGGDKPEPICREVMKRDTLPVQNQQATVEARATKLPKPRAKDMNKRDMTFEEKSKLGKELEELPQEKMVQLVQILKRRNGDLVPDGNEIELDFCAIDTETLWELDRFVSNHKKTVSKIRRQSLLHNQILPAPTSQSSVMEATEDQKMEEDVDIGEEIPVGNFPSVEIQKDVADCASDRSGSSSSSGSSDDSSSSDSDSSSESDSETDSDQKKNGGSQPT